MEEVLVLIVAGTFVVTPEGREEFLASREATIRRSRGEAGCVEYSFAADSIDPGTVRLFEIWESREHLAAHQELMRAEPLGTPASYLERHVSYYEIDAVLPSDLRTAR